MAFGKASFALLCLGTLALINYTNAACTIAPDVAETIQIAETALPGSLIQTFTATAVDNDFNAATVPLITSGADVLPLFFVSSYFVSTKIANITMVVGDGFPGYLDNGGPETFKPDFTFVCPDDANLINPHDQWMVHVTDLNTQTPTFEDLQEEIVFELSTWTAETNLLNSKPFIVKDLDATAVNQKVEITAVRGINANITVELVNVEPNETGETHFNLKLNEGTTAGHHNVTLKAKNTALAPGNSEVSVEKTISIIVNGSMQQTGAFVMVALLSVVAAFFGKY